MRRLAIDATLRAAAPFQRARVERRQREGRYEPGRLCLEPEDIRAKRLARKAGALIIFAVDASGSMALNRMAAAKGACLRLLAEAYRSRDQVSVIPICNDRAEVLLPPTRSITLASRRLEVLPCGGGTPLAHGLSQAVRLGARALSTKDVGRVLVVLITDGLANVSLGISNGDPASLSGPPLPMHDLEDEVRQMARRLAATGTQLLVIDTGNPYLTTGLAKDIAVEGRGKYCRLPVAAEAAVSRVSKQAVQELRSVECGAA